MDTTIKGTDLRPITETILPKDISSTTTSLLGNSLTQSAELDMQFNANALKANQEKDTNILDYQSLLEEAGIVKGKETALANSFGASDISERVRNIDTQMISLGKGLRDYKDELYRNPNLTQTLASRSFSEQERKTVSDLANLAIVKDVYKGDYNSAMQKAKDKVASDLAPIETKIMGLEYAKDLNKDSWNQAERNQIDLMINKEKREYDEQKNTLQQLEVYKIEAIKNNQGELAQEMSLLSPKSPTYQQDLAKLVGKIKDPMLALQMQKLRQDLNRSNSDSKVVKINGVDYIQHSDGSLSDPVLPGAGDMTLVKERLRDKIFAVDELAKSGVGLSTSAGSLRSAPIIFRTKTNDWRAGMVNVIAKLTVDELGRVKSDGVTFGALSNGERQAVGDAATVLSAGQIYKGSGDDRRGTGKFKISEKKVQESLNIISKYYKIDYEKRLGVPYSEVEGSEAYEKKLSEFHSNPIHTAQIESILEQYPDYSAEEILQVIGL